MIDATDNLPLPPSPSPTPRPRWTVLALGAALVVIGLLGYGIVLQGRGQVAEGPAPEFTLQTFEGQTIRLSDYRGTPVVINFWSSWCIPCRTEMPLLETTWRQYGEEVRFIGVAYVDTENGARAFLEDFEVTYPNGLDLGTRISDAYRIKGVPETFFIDRDGQIVGTKIGPLTEAELKAWLAQLLK